MAQVTLSNEGRLKAFYTTHYHMCRDHGIIYKKRSTGLKSMRSKPSGSKSSTYWSASGTSKSRVLSETMLWSIIIVKDRTHSQAPVIVMIANFFDEISSCIVLREDDMALKLVVNDVLGERAGSTVRTVKTAIDDFEAELKQFLFELQYPLQIPAVESLVQSITTKKPTSWEPRHRVVTIKIVRNRGVGTLVFENRTGVCVFSNPGSAPPPPCLS